MKPFCISKAGVSDSAVESTHTTTYAGEVAFKDRDTAKAALEIIEANPSKFVMGVK